MTPQSPPPPPKPPSPSFELGLSSFPPLPGAAGQLKTDDVFDNRLASSVVVGSAKERVSTDAKKELTHRVSLCYHLADICCSFITVVGQKTSPADCQHVFSTAAAQRLEI